MSRKRKNRKSCRGVVSLGLRDRARRDQGIWIGAIEEVRRGLMAQCRDWKPDKVRFQDGRLSEALWRRIEAEVGKDCARDPVPYVGVMFRCYWVITVLGIGYGEAVRLHVEEMKARGVWETPRSFCAASVGRFEKDGEAWGEELLLRVESIVSWVEAQESFAMWLEFKGNRVYWLGVDRGERLRAFQASMLAGLMMHLGAYVDAHRRRVVRAVKMWESFGIGTDNKGVPWTPGQWANILEQATTLAKKLAKKDYEECTPLEAWVWWCYPVFRRYGWSAREVSETASARGFDGAIFDKGVDAFRRHWMSCGLRFAGKKNKAGQAAAFIFCSEHGGACSLQGARCSGLVRADSLRKKVV